MPRLVLVLICLCAIVQSNEAVPFSWHDFTGAVEHAYTGAVARVKNIFTKTYSAIVVKYIDIQENVQKHFEYYQKVENIYPNISEVRFYLYRNLYNPYERYELIYNDIRSVIKSKYNPNLPLVLITHGFKGDSVSAGGSATYIKLGYFNGGYVGTKANIVLVDWSLMSGPKVLSSLPGYLGLLPSYVRSASNVYVAAQRVSEFLIFLTSHKLVPNSGRGMHLIGHSLGAHVLGMAAYYYKNVTGDIVHRVTGTDPAGPLFQFADENERFDRSNARFVDAIHTNQYEFGFVNSLGSVDFYVNGGGPSQPQCQDEKSGEDLVVGCSHNLAPQFFAESLVNRSILATCYSDERSGTCNVNTTIFGEDCPETVVGPYYVEFTASVEP